VAQVAQNGVVQGLDANVAQNLEEVAQNVEEVAQIAQNVAFFLAVAVGVAQTVAENIAVDVDKKMPQ
jgi:hypothetical protein